MLVLNQNTQRDTGRSAQLANIGAKSDKAAPMKTAELFKELSKKHSLMVVEHDMDFIEALDCRVTVLHEGSVLAEGSLANVKNNQQVIEVYLGR